jgi:hypothetical protein
MSKNINDDESKQWSSQAAKATIMGGRAHKMREKTVREHGKR